MSDQTARDTGARAGDEVYSFADHQAQVAYVSGRRAAQWVPFLLPHLRPGMRLLDCGCGVGSITLDLARAAASTRGLANSRFETGSIYALPFADASFDVVLAHTVLIHLSDPLRALKEMRRVLAPGGIAAVSDDDHSAWVVAPADSVMRRLANIASKVIAANGGNPYYSPNLRRLMLDAGFARTEGYAVAAEKYGVPDETRRYASIVARQIQNPDLRQLVQTNGWASSDELETMPAEVLAWGERPDAFAAIMYCAALGWVDA